jgi:hypothetical protein
VLASNSCIALKTQHLLLEAALAFAIHAPSFLWSLSFSRNPSLRSAFTEHHRYYGLVRHPANFPSLRCLIERALLLSSHLACELSRSARASRVPFRSFWPCRRSYPGGVTHLFALSSVRNADFVHKIGTRPPLSLIFTRLPLRSLLLRPGHSRSTLSGYIVESLSAPPFPIVHRLLATWLQSFTTFGTWR